MEGPGGRQCAACGERQSVFDFSKAQWRKGAAARCRACVADAQGNGGVLEEDGPRLLNQVVRVDAGITDDESGSGEHHEDHEDGNGGDDDVEGELDYETDHTDMEEGGDEDDDDDEDSDRDSNCDSTDSVKPDIVGTQSPRGGFTIAREWFEHQLALRTEIEALKVEGVDTAKLPSIENLDMMAKRMVRRVKLTRTTRNLLSLKRLRDDVRTGAARVSLTLHSKKTAAYASAWLRQPTCLAEKITLVVSDSLLKPKNAAALADLLDAISKAPKLRSLKLHSSVPLQVVLSGSTLAELRITLAQYEAVNVAAALLPRGVEGTAMHRNFSKIRLEFDHMNQAGADALGLALSSLPTLRKVNLDVQSDKRSIDDPGTLSRILHCSIEVLVLDGGVFSKQFFAASSAPKFGAGALHTLRLLNGCSSSFAPVLEHCPKLSCLVAEDMMLALKHCGKLCRSLMANTSLQRLDFLNTRVGDLGYIAHALKSNTTLETLIVRHQRGSKSFCHTILLALGEPGSRIKKLQLSPPNGRILALYDGSAFVNAMARSVLVSLSLHSAEVPLRLLCEGLSACASLESLQLAYMELTEADTNDATFDESSDELVMPFRRLKEFSWKQTALEHYDKRFLEMILCGNTVVEKLRVRFDEGVGPFPKCPFVDELEACTSLQELELGLVLMTVDECVKLSNALRDLPKLRLLNLSHCEMPWDGDGFLDFLCDLIVLPALISIDFGQSGLLEYSDVPRLTEALGVNPPLRTLLVDFEQPAASFELLAAGLMEKNYHLAHATRETKSASFGMLLRRNMKLVQRTQEAVFCLIAIREHRRAESGLLGLVPRELVKLIARYLWSTRHDSAWDDGWWRPLFAPSLEAPLDTKGPKRACHRCGGFH